MVFVFENTVKLTAVLPRLNRVLLRERGCFEAAAFLYVEAAAVEADIE